MNIKQILKDIHSIDEQILKVYKELKLKEYNEEDFNETLKELKKYIDLENYLYLKIENSNIDLIDIIDDLLKRLNEIVYEQFLVNLIADKIRYYNYSKTDLFDLVDGQSEIMILYRMFINLNRIYNKKTVDEKTIKKLELDPSMVDCRQLTKEEMWVDDPSSVTDIYIDENYKRYYLKGKGEYIRYASSKKNKVLAYDPEVKQDLEDLGYVDILIMKTLLLELQTVTDSQNKEYYIEHLYNTVFVQKSLEEVLVDNNFDCDILFRKISTRKRINHNNKRFIEIFRSDKCYELLELTINLLFEYEKSEFEKSNPLHKLREIEFNLAMVNYRSFLAYLNDDDYSAICKYYVTKCEQEERSDEITNIVGVELLLENMQKLQKILTL